MQPSCFTSTIAGGIQSAALLTGGLLTANPALVNMGIQRGMQVAKGGKSQISLTEGIDLAKTLAGGFDMSSATSQASQALNGYANTNASQLNGQSIIQGIQSSQNTNKNSQSDMLQIMKQVLTQ